MMRPEEIALALLRRWWIVALAALAAATIAYIGTSSQPSTYVVSTRIMAIAEPPDYWMDLYAKNRLSSYRDLINNWEFITGSLQEAGSDIDPGVAQSKLALGHNPDSNIVQIVVTDTEPQRAATIANALADGFVRRNEAENERQIAQRTTLDNQFPGRVTMEKLETPAAPMVPSGPRVRVNTLAGGVLGAVAGLMVAFGTIYLDDTLKTRRDLERYLEWPVLGTIPPTPGDK
ncbi:Wzz/FepE/Etk N-terminal domain-containing protein [soil metagenome]|jgi:capsular polysaccharide biosynthesis protein